ncbi:MAG: efflux transporter outer membrane subunit [Proteobacteria bacterium]|nr:efflux transporter outer membrane subunit [Pseudomonadota bacterium]
MIVLCVMILGSVSLTGCFKPERYSTELDAQKVELSYGDLALGGEVRDRWWEGYGNAELNEFVETVLRENPSLQSAYLRLLDSEIVHKQAEAGYYPNLSFSAGVGYGGTISENSHSDPSYSLGLNLSYEVDLWGKVRAQRRVSELSMQSVQDSAEAAALSLVGNVVNEWFTVLYYRERRELTAQLLEISESYNELVQEYYRNGQTNGMDVLEQRQQLETLRSTLAEIDSNIRVSLHSLSILAGGTVTPSVEGKLPEAIDVGGTVDVSRLIESRPDIRSARRSAQKADAQVVIALADRLPSLRLSASLAFRSSSIVDLFKALLWDVGANFAASIFDGFNKTAAIDRAKISYLSERFSYASTVMQAVAEVEEALLKLRIREQSLKDIQAQLERQREILEVSRQYFASGALDYNRVLSALRSLVSTSQSELEARRALLTAQVALFKSMGGSAWLAKTTEENSQRARERLEALDAKEDKEDKQSE